ncbi:MAG: hypothetical protein HN623_11330, partial [Bdellovibrionales bacterium]|nr:hypothetical protein [Bdellovibrionales bacterium]
MKILCSTTLVDRSNLAKLYLLLTLLLLLGCQQEKIVSISGKTMGTTYSVKFWATGSSPEIKVAKQQIDQLLVSLNNEMSTYIPTSTLSKVNSNRSTDWITIPARLYYLLGEAQQIAK